MGIRSSSFARRWTQHANNSEESFVFVKRGTVSDGMLVRGEGGRKGRGRELGLILIEGTKSQSAYLRSLTTAVIASVCLFSCGVNTCVELFEDAGAKRIQLLVQNWVGL